MKKRLLKLGFLQRKIVLNQKVLRSHMQNGLAHLSSQAHKIRERKHMISKEELLKAQNKGMDSTINLFV